MEYSKRICGETYSMQFANEDFPLRMSSIEEGIGTGRTESLVATFDLSYLAYAIHYDINVPHFIIHDVLETIDKESFSEIVNIVGEMSKTNKVQFIGSILSEKIVNYSFINGTMIRERLSENDKFLKIIQYIILRKAKAELRIYFFVLNNFSTIISIILNIISAATNPLTRDRIIACTKFRLENGSIV